MTRAQGRLLFVGIVVAAAVAAWCGEAQSQELEARAFSASPVGASFAILSAGASEGAYVLDPAVPIGDVQADIDFVAVGGGRTFGLFGRQARVMALFPYARGEMTGDVGGVRQMAELDGLVDPRFKVSVNLRGAPALSAEEFARAPKRIALGAALTVMPPWGQYDGEALVNLGYNRWAFKPEIGVSRPVGPWTFEGSVGAWFFTENDDYQGGTRQQGPIATVQSHIGYTFENRSWLALDATWFSGGRTEVDGVRNGDRQDNGRVGVTWSIPVGERQSVKLTYSTGATTRRGSDFNTVNVTWQIVTF